MLVEQAAAMSALGAPRYSVLVRFGLEEPVRAWAGIGDLEIPADDVETEGGTFQGVGILGNVPALRQLIGGAAERLEFSLTVPSGEIFALADDEAASVRAAPVDVGVIFFDEDWQQSAVAWLWNGTADVPSVSRTANGLSVTRTVRISAGSAFTDRTRPQHTYFTNADQKRRSPTDDFCIRVDLYGINSAVKFPN